MFENENQDWQAEFQQRLSEIVARKFGSLAEEARRLQDIFREASASVERLASPGGADVSPDDLVGVREQVARAVSEAERRAVEQAENGVQERLANVRAEAEARVRQEMEAQIAELRAELDASRRAVDEAAATVLPLMPVVPDAAVAAPVAGIDAEALKAAIEDLDAQRQQADVLATLVRHAANFAPRVVFYVIKGGNVIGWKANGFTNGLNDETVRTLSFPTHASSLLAQAVGERQTTQMAGLDAEANAALLGQFGPPGEQAAAIPLVIRGKAAAVLYADADGQGAGAVSVAAIEALMRVTAMAIELLPARRAVAQPAAAAKPPVATAPAPVPPAPTPAPEPVAYPVPPPTPVPVQAIPVQPAVQVVEPVKEGHHATRAAPTMTPVSEATPPAPTPPPPPTPAPGPVSPVNAADPSAEERAHMDARRFARLLVSEIKLYNEAKVAEGRRSNDLYERLKDDIDRSRQMYEKRVSPSVAAKFDYFYDELVHTLGEGDAAKLGSGCPGPTVPVS